MRATEQKDSQDSSFAAIEVKDFLQAVFVFLDATIGTAGRSSKAIFLKARERVADRVLVERHHGLAVRFLIAGIDESV